MSVVLQFRTIRNSTVAINDQWLLLKPELLWLLIINYIYVFWRDCVPTGSWEKNCYEASVNPEFVSTLARRLNQSCFPAVLQSNQITIRFGTAEARRLNWAWRNWLGNILLSSESETGFGIETVFKWLLLRTSTKKNHMHTKKQMEEGGLF